MQIKLIKQQIGKMFLFVLMCLNFSFTLGIATVLAQEYPAVIAIQLPHTSSIVNIQGKPTLYQELHLTNQSNDSVSIAKVEVLNTKESAVIFISDKEDLKSRFSEQGFSKGNSEMFLLPGNTGIVYLEFAIPTSCRLYINHQITFSSQGKNYINSSSNVKIDYEEPVVLDAPLKDGPWVAIYNPSWQRGHRRVYYTIDGKTRIPGRFAIDFMKVDKNGNTAIDDKNMTSNWYGYDAAVLAVSDGVVASVRTDFIDSEKLNTHPHYNNSEATGNYISLYIGNNKYVFYEHLKGESILVKPGQKVKSGEVIASLGFTGQATAPHLHLHVANKDSPLGAEGVPFVFKTFTMLGSYGDLKGFGEEPWVDLDHDRNPLFSNEHPTPNSVILFGK